MAPAAKSGRRRRIAAVIAVLLVALVAVVFAFGPGVAERQLNRVVGPALEPLSPAALQLHRTLFVADLHADSLLWGRDLVSRSANGHVDVPRLLEGGVALQVFSAVTRVPRGENYDRTPSDASDSITVLALLERWPIATWGSLLQRALYQAERLHDASRRSGGRFRVIESVGDLRRFAAEHRADPRTAAGLLAIEGLHCLEGDLGNLEVLRRAGYRMMGLTHFFDNELGGSLHGTEQGGLTDFGREVVRRMQERDIVVDLAHASQRVVDDVLAQTTRPVVVSHTGVKGTCEHVRNLSDAQLRGIAATGGLVGIGYWDAAICDVSVAGVVKALRYTIGLIGPDHVALGSDFDGSTETPFDAAGVAQLTQGLLDGGVAPEDVRQVMGGNVERLLERLLPES